MDSLYLLFHEETGRIFFMLKESAWADFPYRIEGGSYYALFPDERLRCTLPLTRFEIDPVAPGNSLLRADLLRSRYKINDNYEPKFQILYDDIEEEWYVTEEDFADEDSFHLFPVGCEV